MKLARFVSFLTLLAACGGFAATLMRHFRFAPAPAILLATCIFLLPSMLLYEVWVTNWAPGLVTAVASIGAYALVAEAHCRQSRPVRMLLKISGYLLLFLSYYIYLPVSLLFLAFPVAAALFGSAAIWNEWRQEIGSQIATLCGLAVIYFVATKYVVTPMLARFVPGLGSYVVPSDYYHFSLGFDFANKTALFHEVLKASFNAWAANYFVGLYVIVLCIIGVVAVVRFVTLRREGQSWWAAGERGIVVLAAFLAAAAPILLTQGGFVAFRLLAAPAAVAAMIIVWCIVTLVSREASGWATTSAIGVVTLVAAGFAMHRVAAVVVNAEREYNFVSQKVSDLPISSPMRVQLVAPPWAGQIVDVPLFYDFRLLATNLSLMDGIVKHVLERRGIARDDVEVTSIPRELLENDPDIKMLCGHCIDLNEAGFVSEVVDLPHSVGPMQLPRELAFLRRKLSAAEPMRNDVTTRQAEEAGVRYSIRMIAYDYEGYDIVAIDGVLHAVPAGSGVDFAINHRHSEIMLKADRVSDMMAAIAQATSREGGAPHSAAGGRRSYKGYLIAKRQQRFIAIRSPVGADIIGSELPGVFEGGDENEVIKQIDDADAAFRGLPLAQQNLLAPPRLLRALRHYNIVVARRRVWGFPKGMNIDYSDPDLETRANVICEDEERAVLARIAALDASFSRLPIDRQIALRPPRLIKEGLRRYNVVEARNQFWGFPQGMQVDYSDPDLASRPGVLAANTEAAVVRLIEMTSPSPPHRWWSRPFVWLVRTLEK